VIFTRLTFQPWFASLRSSSACGFHSSFGIGSHVSACCAKALPAAARPNKVVQINSVRFSFIQVPSK